MRHSASVAFWRCYHSLPAPIRRLADEAYQTLLADPHHPALRFKRLGRFWSVRVGLHYRALAIEHEGNVVWFWIGPHAQYDRIVRAG